MENTGSCNGGRAWPKRRCFDPCPVWFRRGIGYGFKTTLMQLSS